MFAKTKPVVNKALKSAREALIEQLVPKYLGVLHIPQEDVVKDHPVEFFNNVFEK